MVVPLTTDLHTNKVKLQINEIILQAWRILMSSFVQPIFVLIKIIEKKNGGLTKWSNMSPEKRKKKKVFPAESSHASHR